MFSLCQMSRDCDFSAKVSTIYNYGRRQVKQLPAISTKNVGGVTVKVSKLSRERNILLLLVLLLKKGEKILAFSLHLQKWCILSGLLFGLLGLRILSLLGGSFIYSATTCIRSFSIRMEIITDLILDSLMETRIL